MITLQFRNKRSWRRISSDLKRFLGDSVDYVGTPSQNTYETAQKAYQTHNVAYECFYIIDTQK